MYTRIVQPPTNKSFFLFGPRGTGKTTWVKSAFPHALYIDLLDAENFNRLLANPTRLEMMIPNKFSDWVIIDEIQRIPELLHEVHRLIETFRYTFILTGSSMRKLKKKHTNLLAGRALTLYMHPLTVIEAGNDFNLKRSLEFGQLPSVYSEKEPHAYLESYVKTYLEQEILQEGLTRNLGGFSRFLETASFSQGSILNISEVARESSVDRKVAENYFSILEDLLIGYRVRVFPKRAKRRLLSHAKFYFFDTGIYRAVRPQGPLDFPEMIEGTAYETLVFQELLAINQYYNKGYTLYYYRSAGGLEVDFILYGKRGIKAFEVKRSDKINSDNLRGLRLFAKDYPQSACYFVYGGKRKMRMGGIEVWPIDEFLPLLPQIL